MSGTIVAVDFDGTCIDHTYPDIERDVPGAVKVLKRIAREGGRIILWTMRDQHELQEAVNWFKEHDIPLFGVNENPEQKEWTSSPKAYATWYIDDRAAGCPLSVDVTFRRPFVNWERVEALIFGDIE